MGRGRCGGFTLTEMLVTIAIIAVVAAIAVPSLLSAKLASNETAAIATLRTLATVQAEIQGSGRIDADNDSLGEYGTFAELTGATGVRRGLLPASGSTPEGSTFTAVGNPLPTPPLSPTLAESLQDTGEMVKGGYGFTIFLPDTSVPAGFVHEFVKVTTSGRGKNRKSVAVATLKNDSGGADAIGVNISEMFWCAYARPVKRNSSGRRVFFTNQQGDILQSPNDRKKQEVSKSPIMEEAAFLGTGITSKPAVGVKGRDGNIWKITN